MSTVEIRDASDRAGAVRPVLVIGVYVATIFLSAFLLFSVQPMFTRMVLPKLGGTPAVWSVAMVFFQTLLLLGYLYAHVSVTYLSARASIFLHLALMAVAAQLLPITVFEGLGDPPNEGAALWLFAVFTLSCGLPFFAIAANGPLLQNWYFRAAGPHAANPYRLYGASNLGSFGALLLYPFVFEPLMALNAQSHSWGSGFGLLAICIAACGVLLLRSGTKAPVATAAMPGLAPTFSTCAKWVFCAFVPSGYLVAVTAHISTDIASAPLLWIIPLALFLLTFVLVFRDKPILPNAWMVRVWPVLFLAVIVSEWLPLSTMATIALHIGAFFVAAMLCHHALYASRPPAERLTLFYLIMSFGGVLGGVFASLVSPALFNGIYEYPVLMCLAFLCLPGGLAAVSRANRNFIFGVVGAALVVWGLTALPGVLEQGFLAALALLACLMTACLFWTERREPLRLAAVAAVGVFAVTATQQNSKVDHSARSFFGVNRVVRIEDGRFRAIVHGTTNHGGQRVLNEDGSPAGGLPRAIAYHSAGRPFAEALTVLRGARGTYDRLGVIGLGAGGLACQARQGEKWSFFEIDPEVIRIARDTRWFRFLADCTPDAEIVQGDARLTISKSAGGFDVLALDAFSSDAIPVHLLTEQAVQLYISKLKDDGALVMHITNRYLELRSVVAAVAARSGLVGIARRETLDGARASGSTDLPAGSEIVVLARKHEHLATLPTMPGWEPLVANPKVASWTDDYANVLGALLRK